MISPSFGLHWRAGRLSADCPCSLSARSELLSSTRSTNIRNLRIGTAIVTLLAATLGAPSSLRAKETTGTVRGFVYDAATGVPLSQVHVEMIGEVTVAATTTSKGAFTVEGVPVGTYRVSYAGANHEPVSVEGVTVIAGEIADASASMPMRLRARGTSSVASKPGMHPGPRAVSTDSSVMNPASRRDPAPSDASRALAGVTGVAERTNAVAAVSLDPRNRLIALNLNSSAAGASAGSAIGIDSSVDNRSSKPKATDDRGGQRALGSALAQRGRVRLGRNGLRFESRDGAFKSEMHLRSQIRLSSPFKSVPRQPKHFLRGNENDLRFRRARFKSSGHLFRPWVRYSTEYDLVGTRMLDLRVTVQKWEWLQFRVGQWKTEFGRERVSSSGRQEFVERSIVNRQFTLDRQKGIHGHGPSEERYAGRFAVLRRRLHR